MNRSPSNRRQDLAPLFHASDFFNLSPFSLMRRLSDDMERAFTEARSSGAATSGTMWIPPIEVSRANGQLKVCAELPGMKPEDVHVEITDEGLVLQGERKQEQTSQDEKGFRRTERQYGSFYRLIPLPENVDPQQVTANYRDGLLEITIPMPEPQKPKRREIRIQQQQPEPAPQAK